MRLCFRYLYCDKKTMFQPDWSVDVVSKTISLGSAQEVHVQFLRKLFFGDTAIT